MDGDASAPVRRPMHADGPFVRRVVRPAASRRLVCLPHAGGGAGAFSPWSDHVPHDTELVAVQLAGRGDRILQAPETDFDALVGELSHALGPWIDRPFVLFGHCGGALLGLELGRRLQAEHGVAPALLVVSGQAAPDLGPGDELADLPVAEFRDRLRRLGGLPPMLDNPELFGLLLPALRADMRLAESYRCTEGAVDFPILAVRGADDPRVDNQRLAGWRRYTTGPFALAELPGGHFYFEPDPRSLLDSALAGHLPATGSR